MEAEEENSKQLVANKLAKLAVLACARLAGLIDHQDLGMISHKKSLITIFGHKAQAENLYFIKKF